LVAAKTGRFFERPLVFGQIVRFWPRKPDDSSKDLWVFGQIVRF